MTLMKNEFMSIKRPILTSKICANVQVQAHFPDTPVEGVAATMTTVLPIFPPLPALDQLMDTDPDLVSFYFLNLFYV